MIRIEYNLAEMFSRILSKHIPKVSLTPKTWLPGTWPAEASKLKNQFGRNGQSETVYKNCLN